VNIIPLTFANEVPIIMVISCQYDHNNAQKSKPRPMTKKRIYSKYTEEALRLLGKEIRLHRIKLNWKESDLAERAGVARATVQKIEKGNPGCAIGLIFEAAVLVGIKLLLISANLPQGAICTQKSL
jgi:DNA-binding XRE family transcriptional regulator